MSRDPRQSTAVDRHVGACLKKLRMARGITQAALAGPLGIAARQIRKYENGESRIAAPRLFGLAKILDVPVSEFFRGMAD